MTGASVRVRIPAREVILAVGAPQGLSLHNVLVGSIAALQMEPTSDLVIVRIQVGDEFILAEVTRDAVARLQLAVHQRVASASWSAPRSPSTRTTPRAGTCSARRAG